MLNHRLLLLFLGVFIICSRTSSSPFSFSLQIPERQMDQRISGESNSPAPSDLYGTGVRIGIYLQSVGMIVSLFEERGKGYKIPISATSIGILAAWTILMGRKLLTFSEAYLVLCEIGCILIPGVIIVMDPLTAANELVGLAWLLLALTWMVAGGIWLFTTHYTQLNPPAAGAPPNLGWIFARVRLNGWFRIFMIVMYSVSSLGLLLLTVFVTGLITFVLRHDDDEEKVKEALKERFEETWKEVKRKRGLRYWRRLVCCLAMIVWTFSLVSCEKVIIWNDLHPENSLTTPGQTIPLFIGIVIAMDGFSAFRKPWLYHFRNYLRNCFSKRSNGDHTRTRVRWTTSIINIFGQTCQDLEFGHQSVLAWSKNKTRLASASLENSIKVWDLDNQLVHNLTGHEDMVTSITWSPQNTWLATASLDKTVKLWDLSTGKDLWSRPRHFSTVMRHVSTLIRHLSSRAGNEDSVTSIAWSPREKWLATAVLDKTVRIWDPANGLCEAALTGHEDMVTSIAWSPNEKWLASASLDKTVRIWCQPTSWRLHWSVLTLKEHKDSVTAIAWSHNGTKLASASDDGTIKIWNPGTDKSVKTCQGFSGTITSIAWSLDETQLASASDDGTIRIWNPGTDKSVRTWGFNGRVISVAWSLDGTRLSTYDFGI